jgi:hypothetical protein
MEQFAIYYLIMPSWVEFVLLFLTLALAGFVAVSRTNSDYRLKRAPFFFAASFLFLILSLTSVTAYMVPTAIAHGYLSGIIALYYGVYAVVGFVGGVTATARSLDAYGDRWHWFYSLIPIANLALLFKPSQQRSERTPTLQTVGAVSLVLLGIVCYGAGRGISQSVERDVTSIAQAMNQNPAATRNVLKASVNNDGIEAVLKSSIAEIRLPIKVDKITTLTSIDVAGRTLHYGYTVTGGSTFISDANKGRIMRQFCVGDSLKPFIEAGATIRATYTDDHNNNLGEVNANTDLCAGVN